MEYGITVLGSVVTKKTARGYLKRISGMLLRDMTMESSNVLSQIEMKIVSAGMLTWIECDEIEIEAIKEI